MNREEPELDELFAAAAATWPGIGVAPARFRDYLTERRDPGRPLSAERAADLYLACACVDGDPAAIAAFVAAHRRHIDSVVRAVGGREQDIEEVRERILEYLFVPEPGRRPGIAGYGGGGRLKSWLRVIAARTGARYLGEEYQDHWRAPGDPDQLLRAIPAASRDPELEHLRARFGAAFRAAFARALEALSSRERNLLRQHYIDQLTVDEIGALYRVHRATAARWVAAARENVLEETRASIVATAGIGTTDLGSLLRLLQSPLDVSVQRLLAAGDEP